MNSFWFNLVDYGIGIVALLWAIVSLAYLWASAGLFGWRRKWFDVFVVVSWAIGPPLILAIAYFWFFDAKDDLIELQKFRQAQEVVRDFWLAVGALVLLLYFQRISAEHEACSRSEKMTQKGESELSP